jgi:hypothetical protein
MPAWPYLPKLQVPELAETTFIPENTNALPKKYNEQFIVNYYRY